jgi:hypothetical protein
MAARLILQAPLTEVLAVVTEQSVAVLADPGARAARHFIAIEPRRGMCSDRDRACQGEACERNLFHRTAAPFSHHGPVVNDVATTDIDTVMEEATARRNQVRAQGGLLSGHQESVTVSEYSAALRFSPGSASIEQPSLREPTATKKADGCKYQHVCSRFRNLTLCGELCPGTANSDCKLVTGICVNPRVADVNQP